jgi:hypothetical protein
MERIQTGRYNIMQDGDLRLRLYSNAAALLFLEAKETAQRAQKWELTLGAQNYALTTIVLCVVVAEAGINEISEWFQNNHSRPPFNIPHSLPYGFHRYELRAKWSLLPLIARQRTFDFGAEPWQSFDALVELRNAIVHLRSNKLPNAPSALLKAKKLDKHGTLGFKAAQWACETTANMFEKLTELVAPPKKWMNLIWCWTSKEFSHGLSTPGHSFEVHDTKVSSAKDRITNNFLERTSRKPRLRSK